MVSLRVGGLTHVICNCCGHRYRVNQLVPDDSGGWVELKCTVRSCGNRTAMRVSDYRSYGSLERRTDKLCIYR
jgi:hypothetical protein